MVLMPRLLCLAAIISIAATGCSVGKLSSKSKRIDPNSPGMVKTSRNTLSPVYAPLAEQLVSDFNLRKKQGIGIDLGSGPGTLILELCERTELHWINTDINPDYFIHFFSQADKRGHGGRVSAVFADAHALPFHDGRAIRSIHGNEGRNGKPLRGRGAR